MKVSTIRAILISIIVIAIAVLLGWGGITIYNGIPDPVAQILLRNYHVVVVFPLWSILCAILLVLFKETTNAKFDVSIWGLKFSGAGGLAIIWVLATVVGILIVGHYWKFA